MGIRAGLTSITADVFEQIKAGGEPEVDAGIRHAIDKSWRDFHMVFRNKGAPLCFAIAGDFLHPESLHSLDGFCEGKHEYYVGFASPRLVQEVARSLSALSLSQLTKWYEELGVGGYDTDFCYFKSLKGAYVEAAARGDGLMIVIA